MSLLPSRRALLTILAVSINAVLLSSCGDGVVIAEKSLAFDPVETELRQRIQMAGVTGDIEADRTLPAITDPLAQLGKDLFFTAGLGGNLEVACVTCHHPNLGGGDDLSLSVGVGAVDPSQFGPGRVHQETGHPNVPRNAPTVFNMGFWDKSIFWDGRVENLEVNPQNNGLGARIRTPDTPFGVQDANKGGNLTSAQAHFPITSAAEMRSANFAVGANNATVRALLAARIGDYGDGAGVLVENNWEDLFRNAFADQTATTDSLINYENIAIALSEYERSMVFTDNPFNRWVAGDQNAISEQQKRGALLFYTSVDENGAGCSNCHTGDFFTDELMHAVANIQIGEGKGNGNVDDFGRERETGLLEDRYKFRTPTLLNVAVTGPYGHAGSYDTLAQVVGHYSDPERSINDWFNRGGVCSVDQFSTMTDCAMLYPEARANSALALQQVQLNRAAGDRLFVDANLTATQEAEIVSFLEALTDPCVEDPMCMRPWVADPNSDGPDGLQVNGVDQAGVTLAQ